jgi:hypothetical protein
MRSGASPDARLRPMVLTAIEKRAESIERSISARFLLCAIAISRSIHREIASLYHLLNAISRDELARNGDEAKKKKRGSA